MREFGRAVSTGLGQAALAGATDRGGACERLCLSDKEDTSVRAMILDAPGEPLRVAEVAVPEPGAGQVLLRVRCCAVCRTDLHVVDGELPDPELPLIPGHQVVGTVVELGVRVERFAPGDRVGV